MKFVQVAVTISLFSVAAARHFWLGSFGKPKSATNLSQGIDDDPSGIGSFYVVGDEFTQATVTLFGLQSNIVDLREAYQTYIGFDVNHPNFCGFKLLEGLYGCQSHQTLDGDGGKCGSAAMNARK